jgi:uncharacterized protein YciI
MNICNRRRSTSFLVAVLLIASMVGVTLGQERSETQASPERPEHQYVVILKPGPNWIQGKSASEQPLLEHGGYLHGLMNRGTLQLAGPFLDNTGGGMILLNVPDESEARQIVEHDPGVLAQTLQLETIRPFRTAFDAATGKSPFNK